MKKIILIFGLFIFTIQFINAQSIVQTVADPIIISNKDHSFIRPSWAPTGDKIAFTGLKQKGIWIFDLKTAEIEQLTDLDGSGYKFSWSPDGEFIAYRARYTENYRSKMAIEVINIHNKKTNSLISRQKQIGLPQWGRDNHYLFFTRKEKLQKIDTGIKVTHKLSKKNINRKDIIFSSYGKIQIAYIDKPDSMYSPLSKIEVINSMVSPLSHLNL